MNRANLSLKILLPLFILFGSQLIAQQVTPKTALQAYIENDDPSFSWEQQESYEVNGLRVYNLLLTSQKWHEYTWRHQLAILVPPEITYDKALLYITGGSNTDEMPKWKKRDDDEIKMIGAIAAKNKAIAAVLCQVPNQPLYDGLKEDALISFTLHNYLKDHDYTWPLLFPMTKSAIRAMDAVQQFSSQILKHNISGFLVSGASKRGWTTWLTGAYDSRVVAIAPMVINMLNMPKSIPYHVESWGNYSEQIQDYVNLGVAQKTNTPEGKDVVQMIDPFSYREKLTMPKLIFNGTNDPYWPVDAIKLFFDQIPGENYLLNVANAGHDLGDKKQAMTSLSAFFGETLQGIEYPACSWDVEENKQGAKLKVRTSPDKLAGILLWKSDSDDRDFRDNHFVSEPIKMTGNEIVEITVSYPKSGFRAFYVDLQYYAPDSTIYTKSTRIFLSNNKEIL
ncbi:MAG TPA: PhoPQ-activated protein PqaA family protein [Paludibacteraceae bacterium]|nr:PhoPQ-activated protein PqaA family protein [Paludibacteraceae bacterium]HQK71983.1 PhoPQ-activated protein PqaA family protein [Bacteroidales bacterium]